MALSNLKRIESDASLGEGRITPSSVIGGKAMILAAGLGTRLKPWTDHHPKALALINGKSLLQRNIEYLQQYGIYNVVVNVHHFADQVTGALQHNQGWGSRVTISDETDAVLETGGGLQKAKPYLTDQQHFVLMNVDILTDMRLDLMLKLHQQKKPLATLATTDRTTSRYFLFDEQDQLCGWRNAVTGEEKIARPAAKYIQKAFSGIHIIDNRLFSLVQQQGKFSIVDVYLSLAGTEIIQAFDHSGSHFIDVGKPESIVKAEVIFH